MTTHINHQPDQNCIIVTPASLPDADEFELWGQIFLHLDGITLLEFHLGADRHQWRFSYAGHPYNLNFEHYSDSIWIMPEGLGATEHLPDLVTLFRLNLQQ
ncbi:DUF3630 domain-containing protein [Pseudoalteromonas rubra]|uniref:DUF3630 domain-containing protein n=1 Tax=Pseudoalteromonas rubra TaxID=43658 RepID=A0A5S3WQR8_9GAMM|nr:DUF3630 domain-containing protein [Pseudoalteromonas rubra]TMP33410.1 DUF3630 domain-containing protein [Pseudoalteromonas rubra]